MLVVKVELWPLGNAEEAKPLGVIAIANRGEPTGSVQDAEGNRDLRNYSIELQSSDGSRRRSRVQHWRRRGWLTLVRKALEALDA